MISRWRLRKGLRTSESDEESLENSLEFSASTLNMARSLNPARLVSLGSGSSGNALYIELDGLRCLVDCGIPPMRLRSSLASIGVSLQDLSFVFISHEHIDHVRGLNSVVGSSVPVVTSPGTAAALGKSYANWIPAFDRQPISAGPMVLTPVSVSHDAAQPMGLLLESMSLNVAIFTDLGAWDERLVEPMLRADLLVLEANHDGDMLRQGPYPPYLKRRIASPLGHLSNDDCGRLTRTVRQNSQRNPTVFLAHLSVTNNTPDRAILGVARAAGVTTECLRALPRYQMADLHHREEEVNLMPQYSQKRIWSAE
jgi:phosphoribosyl 1,2-cyclic phosphodiesterase